MDIVHKLKIRTMETFKISHKKDLILKVISTKKQTFTGEVIFITPVIEDPFTYDIGHVREGFILKCFDDISKEDCDIYLNHKYDPFKTLLSTKYLTRLLESDLETKHESFSYNWLTGNAKKIIPVLIDKLIEFKCNPVVTYGNYNLRITPNMKTKHQIGFIQNTANDYDMSYTDVETIYDKYYYPDASVFYDKLEEFIRYRSESEI